MPGLAENDLILLIHHEVEKAINPQRVDISVTRSLELRHQALETFSRASSVPDKPVYRLGFEFELFRQVGTKNTDGERGSTEDVDIDDNGSDDD
ncbi:hypothetical protein V865_001766 [Kwoniella europaea PYCC6329]|uniref:Uncharacterized protein n=1 Tax=Kwoniella europaea PYCC6329 TaxID=1423913 RepID=A0AAX4KBF8_9TREE